MRYSGHLILLFAFCLLAQFWSLVMLCLSPYGCLAFSVASCVWPNQWGPRCLNNVLSCPLPTVLFTHSKMPIDHWGRVMLFRLGSHDLSSIGCSVFRDYFNQSSQNRCQIFRLVIPWTLWTVCQELFSKILFIIRERKEPNIFVPLGLKHLEFR